MKNQDEDGYWSLKESIHKKKINALFEIQEKMKIFGFSCAPYEIQATINTEYGRESLEITVIFPKDENNLEKIISKRFKSLQSRR